VTVNNLQEPFKRGVRLAFIAILASFFGTLKNENVKLEKNYIFETLAIDF